MIKNLHTIYLLKNKKKKLIKYIVNKIKYSKLKKLKFN